MNVYQKMLSIRIGLLKLDVKPNYDLLNYNLRPSQFFYEALGLDTVLPGHGPFKIKNFDSEKDILTIKVKAPDSPVLNFFHYKPSKISQVPHPPSDIYGKNTFEMSCEEILSIIEGEEIYLAPSLPLEVYEYLKDSISDSDSLPMTNAIEGITEKFPNLKISRYLSALSPYEIGTMVVKKDNFWSFVDANGKIIGRKPGDKDILKLITCSGLYDFQTSLEKLKAGGCFELIYEMFLTIFAAAGPKSVLIVPSMNEESWIGDKDYYWKAFFEALLNSRTVPIQTLVLPAKTYQKAGEEPEYFFYSDIIPNTHRTDKVISISRTGIDIVSYASEIRKNLDKDVEICVLNVSNPDVTLGNRLADSNTLPTSLKEDFTVTGTAGLCWEWLCRAKVVEYRWPVNKVKFDDVQSMRRKREIVTDTEIIIEDVWLKEPPNVPEGVRILVCSRTFLNIFPNLPESLKELDFSFNQLTKIVKLPSRLEKLNLENAYNSPSNDNVTLPRLPESLKELNCSDNRIRHLSNLPKHLEVLNCSKNHLERLENLPRSLRVLNCRSNHISRLQNLPPDLEELVCDYNFSLKTIPLPNKLKVLKCGFTGVKSLRELPDSLEVLEYEFCNASQLPLLPRKLRSLAVNGNDLTELPNLHSNLKEISCSNNKLTELPKLPKHLEELDCSNNKLTELPKLPKRLKSLYCFENILKSIPELPSNLTILYCSDNEIIELPQLPDTILQLIIHNNKLKRLPPLPKMLRYLECYSNELTELPSLPEGMININCNNNKLTKLPPLPDTLFSLKCKDNQIAVLPKLPLGLKSIECDKEVMLPRGSKPKFNLQPVM